MVFEFHEIFFVFFFFAFRPPFTLQRLCELLISPQLYAQPRKFLFAVEKLVYVNSVSPTHNAADYDRLLEQRQQTMIEAIQLAAAAAAAAAAGYCLVYAFVCLLVCFVCVFSFISSIHSCSKRYCIVATDGDRRSDRHQLKARKQSLTHQSRHAKSKQWPQFVVVAVVEAISNANLLRIAIGSIVFGSNVR